MNKKVVSIGLCTLVVLSSLTTILVTNNGKAENPPEQTTGSLPYDFMWFNVTENLSNIIYTSYHGNVIRKGRSFGTPGEHDSADYIYDIMANKSHLENVKKLPLGPIQYHTLIEPYRKWYYTSKVDVVDYNLTVNYPNFPYQNAVNGRLPYNETFPFPSGCKNTIKQFPNDLNYNHTFRGIRLFPLNLTQNWSFFGGQFTGQYYNVTNCSELDYPLLIIGNATYAQNVSSLPEDQDGRVFLIDEEAGCEAILDNITNASAVVLMQGDSKYSANQSKINNCTCQLVQVDKNKQNLTTVVNELKNGTVMMVDNYFYNNTLTFTYGFDDILNWNWPEYNFSIITWFPTPFFTDNTRIGKWFQGDFTTDLYARTLALWLLNQFLHIRDNSDHGWCHGLIIYDSNKNTHMMNSASRNWVGLGNIWWPQFSGRIFDVPGLQMFSVNYSVGKWLEDNYTDPDDTVSGFFEQTYIQEKHPIIGSWTAGVTASNVEGNITTKNNPTNAIVICGNRYDAWWGQCPGDSGAGAGMVLAIAKYMKDNNITPKYNITFLETTGEEYGFRGAWHYSQSHPADKFNIIRWISFEQLGFTQDTGTFELIGRCKDNGADGRIIRAIANDTNFESRTSIVFNSQQATLGGGVCEDVAWLSRNNCKTVLFEKDGPWSGHHEAGLKFTEGDSMKNENRSELNATLDLGWGVMKYYTVNPNCHFHTVSYEATNTTGGTAPDSIKATFTVKSVLPSDLVMINAAFYDASSGHIINTTIMNYTTDRSGVEHNITLSMPPGVKEGEYYIRLDVYNSTARINRKIGFTNSSNDTEISPTFHLNKYHTLGDIRIGTANANIHNTIRGSQFTVTEDALVHNITAYVYGSPQYPPGIPTYQCMIYRISDGHLMGYSNQVACEETGWHTFTFTPKPKLVHNTQYMLSIWGNNDHAIVYSTPQNQANGYENGSYTFGTPPQTILWDPVGMLQQYSLFCWYTLDIYPPQITGVNASPHTVGFGYNVTITANVTDNKSGVNLVKVWIGDLSYRERNNTMTHISGNMYRYVFNDTWQVGQYNYSIWAVDNSTNSNSSSGHHFHVSANATITVCTLKNNYSGNEYINITDPPGGGDDGNDTQEGPYRYWSPPGNSFGVPLMKTVNYTFFWSLFKNHSSWQMQGWNPQLQQWQDSYQGHNLNEYLHITCVRNETTNASEKVTLNFTSPYTTRYRFLFGIDLRVKNYVNRTGRYEYTLTYPASETENYTVFFNWSDVVPLVQQGKITLQHGIKNMSGVDTFWFMITGNSNLPAGQSFELDPTFGSEDLPYYPEEQDAPCMGGYYQMNRVESEADELVTFVYISGDPYEVVTIQGAIYNDEKELIGETDEVEIELDEHGFYEGYVTLPFRHKPVLSANEWYYLVFGYYDFDDTLHTEYYYVPPQYGGSGGVYADKNTPPPMPDPFAALYVDDGGLLIWCSYTLTDNPPIQSNATPVNGSTGVAVVPLLQVSCSDSNGDMMSATWWTNRSGSWAQFASNASIANNTIIRQTNGDFNNYSRRYYWRVCLTDGTVWTNKTYHFTTGAIETSVDTIAPYTVTSSPHMINATGSSDLDNVTLHYGYSSGNTSDWWGMGWSCRKKITINSSQVTGNFSGFPLLVNITDSGLASHAQEDGDDIVFVLYGDNTTRVNHEIETFNGTTGKLCAWVNIPSLRSTGNTMLWMYYGNQSCGSQQNATGVWGPSFKAVWHLSESPTSTVHDSTGNNNDMASAGSMTSSDLVNGRVGKAIDFDGSNDYLSALDSASLKPTSVSLLAWYYPRSNCTGRFDIGKMCMDKWGNYDACSYGFDKGASGPSSNYTGVFERNDNGQTNPSKGTYTLNAWHFLATTHDGSSSAKVYVDGMVGNLPTVGVQALRYESATNFYIAASHTGVGSGINRWTSCIVDEVWVINGVLNESTIETLYNNQHSPSTFMFCGSEENSSIAWMTWNNSGNPDGSYPWSWSFDFPNSTGYYKFYSVGKRSGSADEITPETADAHCYFMAQSKLVNTGSTDIKGYLLMQIQFYNTSQSTWVLDNDTVNETSPRTINIGSQLALDTIFNGKIRASNLQHGIGTYRVYAAFRDPEGNILKTNTGSMLEAWWQFSKA